MTPHTPLSASHSRAKLAFMPRPNALVRAVSVTASATAVATLLTLGLALPVQAESPGNGAPSQLSAEQILTNKKNVAQTAAAGWLQLLDVGDWGGSWERASPAFRSLVPLAQWMDGIPPVRKPFGSFMSRTLVESSHKTTLPGRPAGDYVTTRFRTDFSEKKGVSEFVTTTLDPDGRWRVTGYSAQ